MNLGIEGKVALIAAASKGLGRAVADELGAEGVRLVICARGGDALRVARDEIADQTRAEVYAVAADVSTLKGIELVAREAFARYGQVDILVNNAGGPPSGPFEKHPWEAWESAVHLTLRSAVELTRLTLPGMRERKWGRVLNITSIAVKQPVDGLMLSNSLRAAVTGWARTLANEVAREGVTVNNVPHRRRILVQSSPHTPDCPALRPPTAIQRLRSSRSCRPCHWTRVVWPST